MKPDEVMRWPMFGIVVTLVVLAALAWSVAPSLAYPAYSEDSVNNTGYCATCHKDFNGDTYMSLQDGTLWPGNLMDTHRGWLGNACTACHQSPGSVPVTLDDSGSVVFPNSCVGCHGRTQDAGTDTGQPVDHPISMSGAGLRQHHYTAGVMLCATCHGDSDPANYTSVGEDVIPFNYATGALSASFNDDPCMDNQVGPTGLDNDGDGDYDAADTDCGAPANTPGEVALLLVTSHDSMNQQLSISYTTACSVSDNTIEFGALAGVSMYEYSNQECAIGNSGAYVWNYPANPESIFFVVVGNDGTAEGSYGRNNVGVERPEDDVNPFCNIAQDLTNPCD